MKINTHISIRIALFVSLILSLTLISTRMKADTGTCGGQMITLPFTDVPGSNIFFCSIAEAYLTGLTNGTTATTYSPAANVTRDQMAAFIARTMDQSLRRGSNRAALNQYWTTQGANNLALTAVGDGPLFVQSDGADRWVANFNSGTVSRVRGSDGRLLETWTGAAQATGVLCALGKVFVTGRGNPGSLYQIDPTQAAGAVTVLSNGLGDGPDGIAFDGERIWTANSGSLSIITLPGPVVTNINSGFNNLNGLIYDGANIWAADNKPSVVDKLHKLDASGNILLSIDLGLSPGYPAFDGTNIWVPNISGNTVTVVRVKDAAGNPLATPFVLATLSGNGLDSPTQAAFDGERMLVNNNDSVSLWKASDLTPIGAFSTGAATNTGGVCSDGLNFWITLQNTDKLARF